MGCDHRAEPNRRSKFAFCPSLNVRFFQSQLWPVFSHSQPLSQVFGLPQHVLKLRVQAAGDPAQRPPAWLVGPGFDADEGGGGNVGREG